MALWKLIPSPSQNQKQKTDSIWDKDSDGDEHLGLKMEAPWEVSVLWGALRMSLHRHRRESKPQPCILTVAKCGGAASPSHTHKTGDCKRALSASCVFLCFSLLFSAVFVLSCCALLPWNAGICLKPEGCSILKPRPASGGAGWLTPNSAVLAERRREEPWLPGRLLGAPTKPVSRR